MIVENCLEIFFQVKKGGQLLRSIMGILALGSSGSLLTLVGFANPFFSVTKKLVASDPVSICMPAENQRDLILTDKNVVFVTPTIASLTSLTPLTSRRVLLRTRGC